MNPFRGIVMLAAAGLAFYHGWSVHGGREALMSYGLGLLALVLAVWHMTRKAPPPRM